MQTLIANLANYHEQLGVQCLAQGHFNTWTGGAGDQTDKRVISGPPARPPGPQPAQICKQISA